MATTQYSAVQGITAVTRKNNNNNSAISTDGGGDPVVQALSSKQAENSYTIESSNPYSRAIGSIDVVGAPMYFLWRLVALNAPSPRSMYVQICYSAVTDNHAWPS